MNIIPGVSEKQGDRISLFSLLNRCRTASGTRMLNQWLRQPLLDCQEINTRLDIVGIFSSNTKVLEELRTHYLGKFPDLLRLCKKFEMGRGNLQDIVKCYQVILMIPRIHKLLILLDSPVIMTKFLSQLQSLHVELGKFSELVEATVDLKATQRHEYIIKATFDDELAVLQSKKEKIYTAEILPVFNDACKNLRLEAHKKVKLEHSDIYGYYIRISRNDARVLDPWKDTYIELCTQKNGIYLTTDSMQHASASYARLTAEYSDKQGLLVKEIIRVASSFSPLLSLFNILISELDVLSSFAELVNTSGRRYCRPLLDASPEASLYLKAARHPTVELQDQMEFIPNDCVFSRDSESGAEMSQGEFNLDSTPLLEPCSFQIITGPNMGGKSTYIRQVGMISLMAQIGCFVPCESAQLPIFDACFARVGASDCQLKGISTFMAEMVEMASILKSATRKSLIIIDELGRGTSSADGYALALAISESIIEKLCGYTLFATHFHELSKLATEYPGKVKNYTVSTCIAASEDLVMLYKVVPGIGDQSFGLHVAKLVGFPKPLITIAKLKALELQKAEIPQFDADFEALIEYGEEILLEHGSENVSGNGQSIEALISSNHKIHELNEKLNTIFS